jgi:hypothetical protein
VLFIRLSMHHVPDTWRTYLPRLDDVDGVRRLATEAA